MCIVVYYQQPAYLRREDDGQVAETRLPESPNPSITRVKARESESRQLTLHSPTSERDSVPFLILSARSLQTSGCITAIYQSDLVETATNGYEEYSR
jgi:hypothetical protein